MGRLPSRRGIYWLERRRPHDGGIYLWIRYRPAWSERRIRRGRALAHLFARLGLAIDRHLSDRNCLRAVALLQSDLDAEGGAAPADVPADRTPMVDLAIEYAAALEAAGRSARHVFEVRRRLLSSLGAPVAAARPEVLAWSRLPDLSRAGLADYLRRRQRGGVSVAETNHDLQTWRAFGNWLLDEGRLAASPFSRMHEGHVPPAPPRVLTSDQIRALLAACRRPPEIRTGADGHHFMRPGAPAWLYPAVLIVAHTGIRPVELARLSWEGVDLERRMAVVRRKGHDYWPLSLPGPVLEWFERVPPAERRGPVVPGFPYHDGTSLMGNYGGPVAMAAEDAGLPGVTLYWLRHTVATELARQGLSEAQLQTAMGWKSSAMARRYVHLVGRDVAGVTDRLPWARPPAAP